MLNIEIARMLLSERLHTQRRFSKNCAYREGTDRKQALCHILDTVELESKEDIPSLKIVKWR